MVLCTNVSLYMYKIFLEENTRHLLTFSRGREVSVFGERLVPVSFCYFRISNHITVTHSENNYINIYKMYYVCTYKVPGI